ncbi:hypothetical protein [Nonomuraea insulae]|uniref:Lipoprotein n=1 Tax=Nonomuraea insulae TaxID=1616787 RepID=A0ABW1CAF5_9ACTN
MHRNKRSSKDAKKKQAREGLRGIRIAPYRSTGSLFLLAALLASGCSSDDDNRFTKAGLLTELQKNPGVPLALPRTLPSGYKIISAEAIVRDLQRGNRVTVRQVYFSSYTAEGGASLVDVCIEELAKPDLCGPPSSEGSFTRQLRDAHIVVNLNAVAPHAVNIWNNATFTATLSEVTWLK